MQKNIRSKDRKTSGQSYLDKTLSILHINCRGCERYTDCCSPDCISCMCEAIAKNGTAEKIRLESAKDTEISGRAAELVCDLARINRPLILMPKGRKCAKCPRHPEAIISSTWAEFPDPHFRNACSRLYSDRNDGPECAVCLQKTYTALNSADAEMERIRTKVTDLAESKDVRI